MLTLGGESEFWRDVTSLSTVSCGMDYIFSLAFALAAGRSWR